MLASEFSRSVLTEGKPGKPVPGAVDQPDVIQELKHFGMHRHFTGGGSVLLFGGGARAVSYTARRPTKCRARPSKTRSR